MIRAYYNDHDKNVCAWLEQLIKNGDITKGDVDDRSITEIKPDDIAGYDRVHFFAGIGTWDYALNQSGWGDRPVLTASLPCQPFSVAGKGLGKADDRHLLPQAVDLIIKSGIDTIFGEQVERAIAHGWLDDLQTVMEAEGYAVGHCVLGAHSVNAPHIRQRLYWVAHSEGERCREAGASGLRSEERESGCGWLANTYGEQNNSANKGGLHAKSGGGCRMADTKNDRLKPQQDKQSAGIFEKTNDEEELLVRTGALRSTSIEWIWCRDNNYRPVKPGIFPLAHGATGKLVHSGDTSAPIEPNNTQEARAMRLKGYGNAIQAQTAEAFIRAFMSI